MYAIIKTGGKQYQVKEGGKFRTEKIKGAVEGDKIEFDKVLMISYPGENGEGKIDVGHPYLEGAKVKAEVLDKGKAEKVTVFKYKKRKRYRKKLGHRQPYTQLKITEIKND